MSQPEKIFLTKLKELDNLYNENMMGSPIVRLLENRTTAVIAVNHEIIKDVGVTPDPAINRLAIAKTYFTIYVLCYNTGKWEIKETITNKYRLSMFEHMYIQNIATSENGTTIAISFHGNSKNNDVRVIAFDYLEDLSEELPDASLTCLDASKGVMIVHGLVVDDIKDKDMFGFGLAVDKYGRYVVVSAPMQNVGSVSNVGVVYIFEHIDDRYKLIRKEQPKDKLKCGYFGHDLSCIDDRILVSNFNSICEINI